MKRLKKTGENRQPCRAPTDILKKSTFVRGEKYSAAGVCSVFLNNFHKSFVNVESC
ncbi:hypothetical protein DPMN_065874 [Dreissena polymorpha]|uniref:Uncharacterized protein n=1 Tax=Dreissena polymorpha TaxID=45954 RepID=A0A9D4BSI1_DREPO|nr:hypothetical protein DPMN_065874 [Dreissena polymorpha]